MKQGQVKKTAIGQEVCLFPMQYMRITQGENGFASHKGDLSIDNAGKDTGIDPVFAPVSARLVWKDKPGSGNGMLWESVYPVLLANGSVSYIHWILWHDNYVSDFYVGQIVNQGVRIGDEGNAGNATGNHSHIGFGSGKAPTGYPLVKSQYGTWVLAKAMHVYDACYINDTTIIANGGYAWKSYDPTIKYSSGVVESANGYFPKNTFVYVKDYAYRDSAGNGKGAYFDTTLVVDFVNPGSAYPYHLSGKGWFASKNVWKAEDVTRPGFESTPLKQGGFAFIKKGTKDLNNGKVISYYFADHKAYIKTLTSSYAILMNGNTIIAKVSPTSLTPTL